MSSTLTWTRGAAAPQRWNLTVAGDAPAVADRLRVLTDADLVAASLAGDASAFEAIVERHQRAVYRLCYRFVPNHEDASDLSQEVFLRAFRALKRFRAESSLATWIYRIGVNVCLTRVGAAPPRHEPIDEQAPIRASSASPADQMLSHERAVRMRGLVARLPEKQRAALILRIYQDMSHQEAAAVLGISVGAMKANVFHALRNLKRLMSDDEGAWS